MMRLGKLLVIAVLALTLLFSAVAVSASAKPIHVAGGGYISGPSFDFSGGSVSANSPIHVAGG